MALTPGKAKKMLDDGTVHGRSLTDKQKRYFGAIAGGATPMKKINGGWLDKYQDGGVVLQASMPSYVYRQLPKKLSNISSQSAEEIVDIYEKVKPGMGVDDYIDLFGSVSRKDVQRYLKESGMSKKELQNYIYGQDFYKDAGMMKKYGIKAAMKLKGLKKGGRLPGASGMMYSRSNTMPPLFTQSEMKAPSFADSLTKAQKGTREEGDLVVLDESNPEIALDEVVVTAPKSKYKYEYEKPEHLKYDPDWWNTGFKGTLDEYNEKYGTDYKEGTALGDYLMDQYYRPQWNEMMLNRDEMQADALNLIGLATTPVSIGPTAITKGPGAFRYLKSGFDKVWNYTPFTKPGFSPTVGNVVNTGFLAEGIRQAPTSISNMIEDPSLTNAGVLALNAAAIAFPGNTGLQYFRPGVTGIAPFIDDASRTLVSRTADGSEYLRRSQEALAGGDRYVRKYFNNPITRSRLDDETVKLLKVPEEEFALRFDELPQWKKDLETLINAGEDFDYTPLLMKYQRLNPNMRGINPGMLQKNLQQRLSKENLDYLYQYQSLPTLSRIDNTGIGPGNILGRYDWRQNDVVIDVANPLFTGIEDYSSLGRNLFNRLRGKGYTDLGDTSKFNQMRTVAVHEGDHFATVGARGNLASTDKRIMAPFIEGMKKKWGKYMDDMGEIDLDSPAAKALKKSDPKTYGSLEYAKYAGTPTEMRARITQLRDLYNIKPGEKIDLDTVKEIIRAGKADDMPVGLGSDFRQFFDFIDDPESLRYILNNMSKTGSRIKKAQTGANFESVERAVRNVESLDGVLMMNPKSSATGLYGQLWNPISGTYDGTREDFAKDTIYQKQLFNDRFHKGIAATETTSLLRDSNDLYEEYKSTVEKYDISYNDIAVLTNFLGRKGTRYYLGYHLRDGKPLEEALPNVYGPNAKFKNKTPEEYLGLARPHYKNGGWLDKYEVIEDDMGQLTNPGKITKINSPNITMKGVDFPVLGISDTGDKKMMQPGKDYKFDGNSVTEYPMAQEGETQEIDASEQIEFLKNWNMSKRGQELLSNSFNGKQRLIDDRTFKRNTFLDNVKIEKADGTGSFLGRYNRGPHRIQMDYSNYDGGDKFIGKGPDDVLLHELSHSQDYGGKYNNFGKLNMPLSDVKLINSLNKTNIKNKKKMLDLGIGDVSELKYIGDPTEVRARLNSIRYFYETEPQLGGKAKGLPSIFDSEVTPEMQETMKINEQYQDLKKLYSDDEINILLNTISDNSQSSGPSNMAYAQEGGGLNKEGVNQYQFLKSYMNSQKYQDRLKKEFPDYTEKQIAEEAKTRLNNVMQTSVSFLPESSDYSTSNQDVQGVYNRFGNKNIQFRPEYSALTPENPLFGYNTTPIHEFAHAADEGGNRIPQSTKDLMSRSTKDNILGLPKQDYYYTNPTEVLGRIQEFRYLLNDQGIYDARKGEFTQEDLDKARKNERIKYNMRFQDLQDNVESDEALIELMNSIAAVNQDNKQQTRTAKQGRSLVTLDQLTNFTNYNTPQPGGWLDKY